MCFNDLFTYTKKKDIYGSELQYVYMRPLTFLWALTEDIVSDHRCCRLLKAYSAGEPQNMFVPRSDLAFAEEATVGVGAWASSDLLCSEAVSAHWVRFSAGLGHIS